MCCKPPIQGTGKGAGGSGTRRKLEVDEPQGFFYRLERRGRKVASRLKGGSGEGKK